MRPRPRPTPLTIVQLTRRPEMVRHTWCTHRPAPAPPDGTSPARGATTPHDPTPPAHRRRQARPAPPRPRPTDTPRLPRLPRSTPVPPGADPTRRFHTRRPERIVAVGPSLALRCLAPHQPVERIPAVARTPSAGTPVAPPAARTTRPARRGSAGSAPRPPARRPHLATRARQPRRQGPPQRLARQRGVRGGDVPGRRVGEALDLDLFAGIPSRPAARSARGGGRPSPWRASVTWPLASVA